MYELCCLLFSPEATSSELERFKYIIHFSNHHLLSWAVVVSRGWAKASACRLQISLPCAVLCQIVSLQYLSRSSLHRLAGLSCRLLLSYGLQVVTLEVHRRLICPAQDHFIFSHFSNKTTILSHLTPVCFWRLAL